MNEDKKVADLSRTQLKDQDYLLSLQQNLNDDFANIWIEMGSSHPVLEQNKDLVLVDMPGWDSGISDRARSRMFFNQLNDRFDDQIYL
ncbi:hypothetical protein ACU5DF_06415 [Aliivibrio wodanis]|uniref:hypothetical protein n=1 Tax=Aliivibrio wodanis TaxID=80852 RepID=UPI00406C0541